MECPSSVILGLKAPCGGTGLGILHCETPHLGLQPKLPDTGLRGGPPPGGVTRSQPAGHLSTDGCADNRRLEIRQGLLTAQWRASGEVGWGDRELRVTQAESAGGLDPTMRPGSHHEAW